MKIKHLIYLLIPPKFRKKAKNIYYNGLLGLYSLKHKYLYGMSDFFSAIALETTTYCNLRCFFCPNSKHERGLEKNKKLMDEELFKKIINELSEMKYKGRVLLFFFGDPLTDKRLPKLINYAKHKLPKSNIEINSNGFLLTLELYHELVKNGLNRIGITQYKKIMPPNTQKVLQYLKEHPKEKNIIGYRIQNTQELSNRGGEIKLKKSPNYERPICCYPGSAQSTIDYDGNWVLCCNDYHSSVKFGNLRNESIIEVWNKPNFKKLRRELRKGVYKLPICKTCVGLK